MLKLKRTDDGYETEDGLIKVKKLAYLFMAEWNGETIYQAKKLGDVKKALPKIIENIQLSKSISLIQRGEYWFTKSLKFRIEQSQCGFCIFRFYDDYIFDSSCQTLEYAKYLIATNFSTTMSAIPAYCRKTDNRWATMERIVGCSAKEVTKYHEEAEVREKFERLLDSIETPYNNFRYGVFSIDEHGLSDIIELIKQKDPWVVDDVLEELGYEHADV